jgi:putative SOS response-associated peptidase YedK
MCGRYLLLVLDPQAFARKYGLEGKNEPALAPRYDIAPTQQVPVVREDRGRRLALLRWGLSASWTKAPYPFTTQVSFSSLARGVG